MKRANGNFEIKDWQEDAYQQIDGGGKMTRADVTQGFTGDIEGEGKVQWLMCYRADGTADFVGMQRIVGTVGDRKGSFVLETSGTFDGGAATGRWNVVPGSGTGELEGMTGEGTYEAPKGPQATFSIDYDIV